jgi:hypothetical protein
MASRIFLEYGGSRAGSNNLLDLAADGVEVPFQP